MRHTEDNQRKHEVSIVAIDRLLSLEQLSYSLCLSCSLLQMHLSEPPGADIKDNGSLW